MLLCRHGTRWWLSMTMIAHSLSISTTQPASQPLYQCDRLSSDPALCHEQVHDFCDDSLSGYNVSSCNRARYCCLMEVDDRVLHFDDEHILKYSASGSESMEYAESEMLFDPNLDSKEMELRYLSESSSSTIH